VADDYVTGSGTINLPASGTLCTLAVPTPARPRLRVKQINIAGFGANNSAPLLLVQICKITNTPSGTGIPAAYGPSATDSGAPTSTVSGVLTASSASPGAWTTAPTAGAVLWERGLPPTSDLPEWVPLGCEVVAPVSSWIGVFFTQVTGGVAVPVNTFLGWTE
jgi:hypothetical protein